MQVAEFSPFDDNRYTTTATYCVILRLIGQRFSRQKYCIEDSIRSLDDVSIFTKVSIPNFRSDSLFSVFPGPYHHYHVVLLPQISFSLAIPLYPPSISAGLLNYILCPYRAVVDKFQLVVLHLRIRVKGSINEFVLAPLDISKVDDLNRGLPEGSLFNSYYTEVLGKALLHLLDCSTLPLILA